MIDRRVVVAWRTRLGCLGAVLLATTAVAQTTATTIFPPPEHLTVTAPDCSSVSMAWTNPAGAPPAPVDVHARARCDGAIVTTFRRGYAYPQAWSFQVRPVGGDWTLVGAPGPDTIDGQATGGATLQGLCPGDYEVAVCATNLSFPTAPVACSDPAPVTVPPPLQGDCNGDGRVTSADVTCAILAGFTSNPERCGDCNADGVVTSADATCEILRLFQ